MDPTTEHWTEAAVEVLFSFVQIADMSFSLNVFTNLRSRAMLFPDIVSASGNLKLRSLSFHHLEDSRSRKGGTSILMLDQYI
ncbi:hypothetical protein QL285_055819 [Trifolium repens]|nr:hypothetical protein QL285_055819 [Trifolium repens]